MDILIIYGFGIILLLFPLVAFCFFVFGVIDFFSTKKEEKQKRQKSVWKIILSLLGLIAYGGFIYYLFGIVFANAFANGM